MRASIDGEHERKRQAAADAQARAQGEMMSPEGGGGAAPPQANPNAPPPRRRHHPDEPLQRPTTPALNGTLQDWEQSELPPGATPGSTVGGAAADGVPEVGSPLGGTADEMSGGEAPPAPPAPSAAPSGWSSTSSAGCVALTTLSATLRQIFSTCFCRLRTPASRQ
mmetsp:Transcript_30820/g.80410  ORF Transcript_30820/g.80410 Transcript_30820/m.80410 type:complete len:166 (+) Transcript_30820:439-936(+)